MDGTNQPDALPVTDCVRPLITNYTATDTPIWLESRMKPAFWPFLALTDIAQCVQLLLAVSLGSTPKGRLKLCNCALEYERTENLHVCGREVRLVK